MNSHWVLVVGVCLGAGIPGMVVAEAEGKSGAVGDAKVREAVERSLPYLEKEGVVWMEEKKCVSCHAITSMLWSLSAAKSRGFDVDEAKLTKWYGWSEKQTLAVRDDPERNLAAENMMRLMLGREGYADADRGGKLLGEFPGEIAAMQEEDGSWKAGGQLPFQKRPKAETNEVSTMWAALALSDFKEEELAASRDRAKAWIGASSLEGKSTEWVALKLLLAKEEGDKEGVSRWRDALLARQREDGGWNFIGKKESEALSTGTALYALGGVKGGGTGRAIAKARSFLVRTQGEEGYWMVPTTKNPKKDKPADVPTDVSNYWGSAWAVIGLCASLRDE